MFKVWRTSVALALSGVLASLIVYVSSGMAAAAETMPELQWSAVASNAHEYHQTTTSPQGDVTVGCRWSSGNPDQDLITYGSTGAITRQLDRTVPVDGTVKNCIIRPVVDKVGHLYGKVDGGTKLFAYDGNTVKWTYDTGTNCSSGEPAVGADGNIYFLDSQQHLIGLAPNLAPGQTAPTKVLDVAVGSSCSQGNLLYAYKDGIAVEWSYGTKLKYVSYGGKMLGDLPTSVGYIQGQAKINADGVIFFRKTISGSPNSYQVTAYNPATAVSWSTTVSTPGVNGLGINNLYPIAGGGVAAMIRERKSQGGLEVIPLEWVYRLVILNLNGQVVNSTTLPNKDASGYAYGNYYATADTTGKLAIVRAKIIPLTSSPYQSEANEIAVVELPSLNVVYSAEIRGNIDKTQGQMYGYRVETSSGTLPTGPNTLYLNTRKCWDSYCYGHDPTLRAVKTPGLGLDYPRGAVLAASVLPQPAPKAYVALGDSYSSGEGIPPFESESNECRRSVQAYARVLHRNPFTTVDLSQGGFWACSGAETKHIKSEYFKGEAPQYTRLNSTTKLVTMGIGGNDMGFTPFGIACVTGICKIGTPAYNTAKNNIDTVLPGALTSTYIKVLTSAPSAHVYIPDYPQLAPPKTADDPVDPRCDWLYWDVAPDGTRVPGFWKDAQAARDIVSRMNAAIQAAVQTVRQMNPDYAARLHYVPVNGPGSPFIGRTVCAPPGESFFNNLDTYVGHESYVLHPNERGAQAYAQIIKEAMGQ